MRYSFKGPLSIRPASITFGTIFFVSTLLLVGVPIFDLVELKTYDLRLLSRGQSPPAASIVLAAVDEKSLDEVGRWPWSRSKIAGLVDALSKDGAKVIGFDIGFLEPEDSPQLALLSQLSQKIETLDIENPDLTVFLHEKMARANNDLILANAIKNSSAAVVLGYFFHMSEKSLGYRIQPQEIARQLELIDRSKYPLVLYRDPDKNFAPFFRAYAPESNLEALTRAAASSGYFNFTIRSDEDGVVRWAPLIIQGGEHLFPPLSILSVWHYLDEPQMLVRLGPYGVEGLQMGDVSIPTDESGQLLINFLGPPKTFPHFSISDILSDVLPRGTFTDKIVLVGTTATGTYDLRPTPLSPVYPGVEIHATIIDNILQHHFLTRPEWSQIYDLFSIVLLAGATGIMLPRMSALRGLGLTIGLVGLHLWAARWFLLQQGVWLNIVYPFLAITVNYIALTLHDYVTEERERKKVRDAFQHYVSPVVVEEMIKDPSRLKLGGEEKILTVLFSDLQGFTAASERYQPHEMIELLSEYYARMTEQIFDHQGMLKEYVGDELMAIFGAPIEQPDHAVQACAAALAMRDHRKALREEWAKMGRPPLNARTGINSGLMLVGNLGSEYRYSYGVLGDQVNLGSRLEGLNKAYKTEILIGENTAQLVKDAFLLREIDMVQVVGRRQPVRVYELLSSATTPLSDQQEKAFKFYAAGLEAYRQQCWTEARALFGATQGLLPTDGPSQTMAERCCVYQEMPPPEGWTGVFEALTK